MIILLRRDICYERKCCVLYWNYSTPLYVSIVAAYTSLPRSQRCFRTAALLSTYPNPVSTGPDGANARCELLLSVDNEKLTAEIRSRLDNEGPMMCADFHGKSM